MLMLAKTIGKAVAEYWFHMMFGWLSTAMNLASSAIWRGFCLPMFKPHTAAPDILGGDGGRYTSALNASIELNEFFLESVVTPIMLLGILIIGIMFLFGNVLDLREKLKDAMPKFILATMLAYTTQIWMDVLMSLGRGLMATVYGRLPRWMMFGHFSGQLEHAISEMGGWGIISALFMQWLTAFMALFLMLGVMLALAVRMATLYAGIAIMPIVTITLGIPYLDAVGKKFIKIWIQMIFFIFWMAIPAILLKHVSGLIQIGFLILIMGMPFLLVTGEVLALRGAGMPSGGQMAQKGLMMAKGGAMMAGKAAVSGGSSLMAEGGGAAGGAAGGGGMANFTAGSADSSGPGGPGLSGVGQVSQGPFQNLSGDTTGTDAGGPGGGGAGPTGLAEGDFNKDIGGGAVIDQTPDSARGGTDSSGHGGGWAASGNATSSSTDNPPDPNPPDLDDLEEDGSS